MLDGYLVVGGNEIVNSARSFGYAQTIGCRVNWLKDPGCATVREVQQDLPYDYSGITDAPWYDPDAPESTSFLGLYGLSLGGLSDSTREAAVVQKTGAGAKITGYRHGSREVRVRGWMTAQGEEAMEYGMTWLRNVLEPDACGLHGGDCGTAEAEFFVDCPPVRGLVLIPAEGFGVGPFGATPFGGNAYTPETDEQYIARTDAWRRYLHSVRCISGPFEVERRVSSNGKFMGRLVEFTLLAEVPFVFGKPRELELPPTIPIVVQDVAFNLAPYPSAEIAGAPVVVATNYCPNPSVETDATGYATTIVAPSSPDPASIITTGRSNDIAAAGAWSYRTRLDASGYANDWGGTAYFDVDTPAAALAGITAGSRLSFSVWAAALFVAGGGTPETGGGYMHDLTASAIFTGGAGGTVPLVGVGDFGGRVFSAKSVAIPAGATSVRIRVRFGFHWSSTSPGAPIPTATDARCYVDAVAVTIP